MTDKQSPVQTSVFWIMLIYFCSGACSLMDEVVWVRLLKLTLGNTVYASSIVVSVFMGGLALGALVMSRYADAIRRHLRMYAILETLVTLSALALPWALKWADTFYVFYYRRFDPTPAHLLFVQVLFSALILLIPSMLMGSTLPLLGRFVTRLEKETGQMVGRLYALNTLGAAAGCFLAGFLLIRMVGVMGTLYTAAGLNLLVAFGGWVLSRTKQDAPAPQFEMATTSDPDNITVDRQQPRYYLLISAFFMSGLISIGYELVWMRSIVHLLGGYTYVFSAVLTVYLLGNVIGVGIGSRMVKKMPSPALGFSFTLGILGIYGVLFLPGLVVWTAKGLPMLSSALDGFSGRIGMPPMLIKPFVQCLALFLPPSIIMGIGFPMALQAWTNHIHKVGRSTGTAYAANTIGAVISGIVTGFVLVPFFGVQMAISIFGLLGIWIALLLWRAFSERKGWIQQWAPIGGAALLTLFAIQLPNNLFHRVVQMNPGLMPSQMVAVKEGIATTVSLHRTMRNGTLQLHSSGQSAAGEGFSARGDQKMLAHMAGLLNPKAASVLSVGFGSGETTATLSLHDFERIDCVEIAPEMVEMSLKYFGHMNLGDRLHDKVNIIYMDAKNYLKLTDRRYDVIINDSIHPRQFAENASLYGLEYFQHAQTRLNDNGVMISWIPTWTIPKPVVGSILRTCMEVFPHMTVWFPSPHYAPLILMVGSNQPQHYALDDMEAVMQQPGVRESLHKIGIYTTQDFMSCYMGDEQDYAKRVQHFPINSDRKPFVEFSTHPDHDSSDILDAFIVDVRRNGQSLYSLNKHIKWQGYSTEEKKRWMDHYSKLHHASTCLLAGRQNTTLPAVLNAVAGCVQTYPYQPSLVSAQLETEKSMFQVANIWMHAGETDKALTSARFMAQLHPGSGYAKALLANHHLKQGQLQAAEDTAKQAVALGPSLPEVRSILGKILTQAGRPQEAALQFQMAWELVENDISHSLINKAQALYNLADAYAAAHRYQHAVEAAQRNLQLLALSEGHPQMRHKVKQRLKDYSQKLARANGNTLHAN